MTPPCTRLTTPRLDLLTSPIANFSAMAHTYMLFDFGTDEEKAQQARHKLDGWRQAFRLDKKLQYKMDRPKDAESEDDASSPDSDKDPKSSAKSKAASKKAGTGDGTVGVIIRLYFSNHEKLSEQRWLHRIPSEEPFKGAIPKIVRQGDKDFDETVKQFDNLD
jgi:hypothetical protein